MNEKIRELAEQAGSTHKQSLGVYQFYTDELEKFAQMIVRECGGIYDKIDNGNPHMGTNNYLKALALHFGVKE